MTWTYTNEYYKNYTRDTWNESAHAYDPIERNLNGANPALLRFAAPAPGDRVLDVASGTGEPALSVATRVLPNGLVLGVDLAERMVERARAIARQRGVPNAEFRVMDAEKLDIEDATFDLVTCRFGLQIVTDPDRAIAEMLRVLKPGGRLAATVWGPGERSPALHAMVGPMLENAEPDETGYLPTPYEMGGEGELVGILHKAGFRDAREERFPVPWRFPSVDGYFESVLKGTPLGHSLLEEEPDIQKAVLAKTRANVEKFRRVEGGGLEADAECVVVAARK